LCIPSSSRSPDQDPHRTIYYLGYPLGRFAGLKHRQLLTPVSVPLIAKSSWLLARRQDLQGPDLTATSTTSQQTSCLPMHPPMKPTTTRTPDVNATGSVTNGADISENPSLYGISQRPSIKSPAGCTLPRTVPHVYHHDSTSGSGDTRGRRHRQARGGCLLHES
jgi:hypothetical protein